MSAPLGLPAPRALVSCWRDPSRWNGEWCGALRDGTSDGKMRESLSPTKGSTTGAPWECTLFRELEGELPLVAKRGRGAAAPAVLLLPFRSNWSARPMPAVPARCLHLRCGAGRNRVPEDRELAVGEVEQTGARNG